MLIQVAAAHVQTFSYRASRTLSILLFVSIFLASPAFALDGIDLSSKPAEMADETDAETTPEGASSELVQIKYSFLSCAIGQIGQSDADELWENSRRIPMGSAFVEGDGYFGEDLNTYY